jgi:GNAT superfamily N-acetyltransferase
MNDVRFSEGFQLESLRRNHPRKRFRSGDASVDEWLIAKAFQNQEKRLSATKVLIDDAGQIAGYFTLATGQVDFDELPKELTKKLPRRMLPVAILAWLGVAAGRQGLGIGGRLLARALRDCHEASNTFPLIAVVLDCINDAAKSFYLHWEFEELPGNPYRLLLSATHLQAMMDRD